MVTFSTLGNVRISGRLGNQMFQYAALRGTAERLGVTYRCPEWLGDTYFQLNESPGQREVGDQPAEVIFEDRKNLTYNPAFAQIQEGTEFKGYFQSEKFFHEASAVREWYQFRDEVITGVRERYKGVDFGKTVSVHLRVGDYLKLSQIYPVQDAAYYERALSKVFSESSRGSIFGLPKSLFTRIFAGRLIPVGWTVLVFSDDLSAAKERLGEIPSTEFVEGNEDFEDLWLMSQCRHHITANSSFSWWGAWLGDHDGAARTVAPKNWFTSSSNLSAEDIYAKGWEVV